MKFLVTYNMAGGRGEKTIHQMIVDHEESGSLDEFTDALNDHAFVKVRQYYWQENESHRKDYSAPLIDKGEVTLNSELIGKAVVFIQK